MEEIRHQLIVFKYPMIYGELLYIPGGCLGFLPSTVWHGIHEKDIWYLEVYQSWLNWFVRGCSWTLVWHGVAMDFLMNNPVTSEIFWTCEGNNSPQILKPDTSEVKPATGFATGTLIEINTGATPLCAEVAGLWKLQIRHMKHVEIKKTRSVFSFQRIFLFHEKNVYKSSETQSFQIDGLSCNSAIFFKNNPFLTYTLNH